MEEERLKDACDVLGPVVEQLKDLGLHEYWVHKMEVVLEDMKTEHAQMAYANGKGLYGHIQAIRRRGTPWGLPPTVHGV